MKTEEKINYKYGIGDEIHMNLHLYPWEVGNYKVIGKTKSFYYLKNMEDHSTLTRIKDNLENEGGTYLVKKGYINILKNL